ncbi:helix-turn-helix domain-containing protein [Candidatus Enterococcus ferrettii]|uniref:Insertion element IS150 protein InsJ-like helix-turn-helix domain-containing protein n=1 Tax=Candidatus Enterococcus ferrettii TaxID=2815324 RepID=A0ABV0EVZ7_9ENTE|nr:helix-turn-helix domain-containing protein [Enterococcus sp. 665A]MBO1338622.1 transposase [Enterococcus sp. 665A]
MGKRRMKLSPEERLKIVESYLRHEISLKGATKEAQVSTETIKRWCNLYENEGAAGLIASRKNKNYSQDLKLTAVQDYFTGGGSQVYIAKKYGLRSKRQLQDWIKVYNTHKDFKSESGGSRMSQTRETSQEERLKIVLECLANNKDYGAMAIKYRVSYQNVYNWVKKYEQRGCDGLQDRRGRRKAKQVGRTPEEEQAIELAKLKSEIRQLRMENDLLKKVRELERRNR